MPAKSVRRCSSCLSLLLPSHPALPSLSQSAQSLGIRRIIIHRYSSILSAYGLALSDRVFETQEPSAEIWNLEKRAGLVQRLSKLDAICQAGLEEQGFEPSGIKVQRFLNMR